jgi:hypothetical protein
MNEIRGIDRRRWLGRLPFPAVAASLGMGCATANESDAQAASATAGMIRALASTTLGIMAPKETAPRRIPRPSKRLWMRAIEMVEGPFLCLRAIS